MVCYPRDSEVVFTGQLFFTYKSRTHFIIFGTGQYEKRGV